MDNEADAVVQRCLELSEELCRRQEATPELKAAWEQLWRDTLAGERLAHSAIRHACMVLSLGASIAVAEGDYARSVELLRSYFAHPDIENAQCECRASLGCNLADSLLHLGEEAEALALYRQVLNSDNKPCAAKALAFAREFVRDFCLEQEATAVASPALTGFVAEVAERSAPGVAGQLPPAASYGQLAQTLSEAGG
ncbi:MAG: hypothetical protein GX774_18025 [Armatimonadetes bacterium]|jgi:tetratricopeptide (TPR) repeat protein|nr:hypothetical protein [Armatimonadota bacterium]